MYNVLMISQIIQSETTKGHTGERANELFIFTSAVDIVTIESHI